MELEKVVKRTHQRTKKAARAAANKEKLDMAFDFLMDEEGKVLIGKLAEGIEGQPNKETVKKWIDNSEDYEEIVMVGSKA